MSANSTVKRTMAEVRAERLGYTTYQDTDQGRIRVGRNTLYRWLRSQGYEWNPRLLIWVKVYPV